MAIREQETCYAKLGYIGCKRFNASGVAFKSMVYNSRRIIVVVIVFVMNDAR